ncbi:hypothetical protein CDD81_3288 [Ophiocordyceps australis]|uniref:Integral membrane protein n=1 Tax=Ophiocordyceps australis TaxID=1399860 RepID=A0A2C5Y8W7_9HYPO|nr:hypothetical protein CDD81_3288 [Ophiocordyceps australis]
MQPNGKRRLHGLVPLPPALRPLLRAYLLAYLSTVAPRILTITAARLGSKSWATERSESFARALMRVVGTGLEPHRFPTFCALLVGGSTLLHIPLHTIITRTASHLSAASRQRLSRWLATFVAACISLRLLQSNQGSSSRLPPPADQDANATKTAGRTLDLTLFAVTQALDILVGQSWSCHKRRRIASQNWTKAEQFVSAMVDPLCFVASCAPIMWAWFYSPQSLPRGYNSWITSAAHVDQRLIKALRHCRKGELRYAEETGQAPLLGSMCNDLNLPYQWGDPAQTVPFPCEIVHMGSGPSCEHFALSRFCLSWKWSMCTYLPLALALQLRKPSRNSLLGALLSASRSSAFLAAYITLFYYGVCLCRTRVGPLVIGTDVASRNRIDGGLCIGTGCCLCGWSVLIETASRRKDMALFVAPRAMATLLPRRYSAEKQWRETLAFAASTAVVFTCVLENPRRVRGMMGGILALILRQ